MLYLCPRTRRRVHPRDDVLLGDDRDDERVEEQVRRPPGPVLVQPVRAQRRHGRARGRQRHQVRTCAWHMAVTPETNAPSSRAAACQSATGSIRRQRPVTANAAHSTAASVAYSYAVQKPPPPARTDEDAISAADRSVREHERQGEHVRAPRDEHRVARHRPHLKCFF